MTPPPRPEDPSAGRFAPRPGREVDADLDDDAAARAAAQTQRHERLPQTLKEIGRCLDDGDRIVAFGKERFDDDWLVQRAAKNIITELAESVSRLPDTFKERRPEVPWHAISGMRNRVVHVYQQTDPEIIWNALASDFPNLRRSVS